MEIIDTMTPQLDLNNKLDFELNELKHSFTHHCEDEILSHIKNILWMAKEHLESSGLDVYTDGLNVTIDIIKAYWRWEVDNRRRFAQPVTSVCKEKEKI